MVLFRSSLYTGLLALFAVTVCAQSGTPSSRAEIESAERDAKAVKPWEPDKAEKIYRRVMSYPSVKNFMGGDLSGWTIKWGGLFPGAGASLGPSYLKKGLLKENLDINFSVVGSTKLYYGIEGVAAFQHLIADLAFFEIRARRDYAPQVSFYGVGNDTTEAGKTNFLFENFRADGILGWRPFRRVLSLGGVFGWSEQNVGPGTSSSSPPANQVYTPAQAPGINRQTPYAYSGASVRVDTRDFPGDPHSGVNMEFAYTGHKATVGREFSFRRINAGVDLYKPFWNKKRVLVFRAVGNFSYTNPGQVVPFYQMYTLGGPDDLRGYARFRFYGSNRIVGNAEYRWEIAPALDMALFADAGRVSDKPGHLALSGLHGSGGFGLRFKSRNAVAMRIDVGFSREGVGFWWTFSDLFRHFVGGPF